jgi:putative iron-regulated protein
MGALSGPELSGERLTVAYETRDQENEHSCFSDTTSVDLAGNAAGVQNVCLGRYEGMSGRKVSGPGLCDVLSELEPPLGSRLRAEIERGVAAARSIPSPFDRALAGPDSAPGRAAIAAAIAALSTQAETLKLASARLAPAPAVATR